MDSLNFRQLIKEDTAQRDMNSHMDIDKVSCEIHNSGQIYFSMGLDRDPHCPNNIELVS